MVVDDKIQKAKIRFKAISKSGRNNYQKYDYFETKDIFPVVREICTEFKLKTKFDWNQEDNCMILTVKDCEDGTVDTSTIPLAPITANDPGKYMQDVGRIQTYAMRYLYIQVFEIAVPDEIDNKDQKKMVKQEKANAPKAKRNKPQKNVSPVKPVKQEKTTEVTAERIQDILKQAEEIFDDYQKDKPEKERKPFTWEYVSSTIRQLSKNEQEYNACKNSLVFQPADTIKKEEEDKE